jgi:purine-binding chemotaxis protein CheW
MPRKAPGRKDAPPPAKEKPVNPPERTRGGKYLTFFLAGQEYGLEVLKVQEIIGMTLITPVPRTPEYIRGVINLRGKVIPVIDLRSKLGLASAEQTSETCIIVVEANRLRTGMVVDKVSVVAEISELEIEDVPALVVGAQTEYILGIGKFKGRVQLLVDIDRALADADPAGLASFE